MYVIATTKKVAILRRFVDFSDLKCQESENVLSRDMSRAPYKTKKKRQKYTHVEKKREKWNNYIHCRLIYEKKGKEP